MADEIVLKVKLDNGEVVQGLAQIERQAKKVADGAGSSFEKFGDAISGISPAAGSALSSIGPNITKFLTSPLGAATAGITAFATGAKFLLDNALAGEKILKVEKQFNALSESFKVSGDSLKNEFIASLDGLVDDSDALESLNRAFVTLGDKVTQLPQVMEIARKATNLFGGEVTQNFEAINQAVATGATRQLRALGINIDATKAYEEYAKQLGVTKDQLSESGRQQAILNAVLQRGEERFKNVSSELGGANSAMTRLSVSFNNIIETFQSFVSKNYSEAFASIFESIDIGLKKITGNFTVTDRVKELNKEIQDTQTRINQLSLSKFQRETETGFGAFKALLDGEGALVVVNNNLKESQNRLSSLNQELAKLQQTSQQPKVSDVKDPNEGSINQEAVINSRKAREAELTQFLLSEQQKRLSNEISFQQLALNNATSFAEQETILASITSKQLESQKLQNELNIQAIKKQFKDDSDARNQAIASATLTNENQITAIKAKAEFDRLALQKRFSQNQLSNLQSSLGTIATLQESSSKELQAVGKAAAISNATIDGYAAVQKALASAPPPFNFAIAAAVGVAAAANIAKIASVGGGGGGGANFSTGGGITASPSQSTELTQPEDLERAKPTKSLEVTIQGNVFDSQETGSRIVRLINEAFDQNGEVITQGIA